MNEPATTGAPDSVLLQVQEWDTLCRSHIASTIADWVTAQGKIDLPTAYRELAGVTNRSVSTVRGWLAYENAFPDLGSLVRIMSHWKIPAEVLFPPELLVAPSGEALSFAETPLIRELEAFNLFPTRHHAGALATQALNFYTAHPEDSIWIRQPESDNNDIRQGELVLIDPSIETLTDNAFYLLKIGHPGDKNTKMCIRFLRRMISEPAVRLSRSDESADNSAEMLPFVNGSLPSHITVLGKVCGHVSKTP